MNSWNELHKASEAAAIQAELISREGPAPRAWSLYAEAAELEQRALAIVDPAKVRTKGITAVSAVALWYKAAAYDRAEELAFAMLSDPSLPQFAKKDLRDLVQAIWTESSKRAANAGFLPGQVLVSVKGGEVTTGGAPLDLIVEKVQTIQAMFYRIVELMKDMPLRKHGAPSSDIQAACRPWLFQAAPGSYQFAVAIQQPRQLDFFREAASPALVADRFLQILEAAGSDERQRLEAAVPQAEYRSAFLKLSRQLAPAGKNFEAIEFRNPAGGPPVALTMEARATINRSLRASRPAGSVGGETKSVEYFGMLRAVDLEKDLLVVVVDGTPVKAGGLEETMDDLIGPMVNKKVKVSATIDQKGATRLVDIELCE